MDLNALRVFAAVVEAHSFSQAARRLGMPISTVSRKIAELEKQLAVRLLERSTRQLRLTDAGRNVLQHAQRCADISDAVEQTVSKQLAETKGTVRLSAPPSIADTVLAPLATEFQREHPEVRILVLVTERFVDPIAEGLDLVFRVGPLDDSSLVARPVMRYRHQLLASPDYLAGHPSPNKPADLTRHRLLAFSFWTPRFTWNLSRGQRSETVSFQPHLAMNDYLGLATALTSAAGIGEMPPIVRPDLIQSGALIEVMPDWNFPVVDVSIVHLGNRYMPKPVRLFKDFASTMAPKLFDELPN
ncbi:MAG: transcriptional regulator [Lysobacteraceae bacterium]|nr:MAG: transcriptional regulator [Xanthomonadaceae bacterium]